MFSAALQKSQKNCSTQREMSPTIRLLGTEPSCMLSKTVSKRLARRNVRYILLLVVLTGVLSGFLFLRSTFSTYYAGEKLRQCEERLAKGEALLLQRRVSNMDENTKQAPRRVAAKNFLRSVLVFDAVEHFSSVINTNAPGRATFLGTSSRGRGRPGWAYEPRPLLLNLSNGAWYLPLDGEPPSIPAVLLWLDRSRNERRLLVWTSTTAGIAYNPPRECAEAGSTCQLELITSSTTLAGSCNVEKRNLSLFLSANGAAGTSCLAEVRMQVTLTSTNAQEWEPEPSLQTLAIVRPFTEDQIPKLMRSLDQWNDPWRFPCERSGDFDRPDLVFYANNEQALVSARAVFQRNHSWSSCFQRVRWIEANVEPTVDVHPDGTCFQFYSIFDDPRFRNYYQYFFLMEPDVHPIRAFWLDSIQRQIKLSAPQATFWIRGSTSKCAGWYAANDFHINGNALYNLSSRQFRDYLIRVQRAFQPRGHVRHAPGCSGGYGGFDHSIFHYAVEIASKNSHKWKMYQKLCFDDRKSPVWNFCKHRFLPWRVYTESNGSASLVHSSWGNNVDFWDPAVHGIKRLETSMLEMIRLWE